jgi:hypothetical protein
VKWRFSALAGGVEGSKLCLFSVIMPAKCVYSVSPRFHYRRLAFCFLPLATIFMMICLFASKHIAAMNNWYLIPLGTSGDTIEYTLELFHLQIQHCTLEEKSYYILYK